MTTGRETADTEAEEGYLAVAAQAVRTSGAAAALDRLGWWDLLPHLDDADLRSAAFTLFRAQGRELGCSPAIGGLLAQPYLDRTAIAPGLVIGTVLRRSARRGAVHVVVGDVDGRLILVDRPGQGAAVLTLDAVHLRPLDVPGRLLLHEVEVDWTQTTPIMDEAEAEAAMALDAMMPPRFDEVVKALAGRNGRRACERALQVLGGIGFTAEHNHHHHHSRVLALDALLGTSAELTHGLGAWLRTEAADPSYPPAVLLAGSS